MPFSGVVTDLLQFKDHHNEARLFASRVVAASLIVLTLLGLLVTRFYYLQVVHHSDYVTQSDANRIRVQPVPPTRGLIYDRNGVLLADNRPIFTLSIVRERAQNLTQTLATLRELIGISADEESEFRKALAQRRRPFEAVPLKYRLTDEEIARIAVNEYRLQGVEMGAQLVRHYPFHELFGHVIGYTARINEQELKGFDPETYQRYSGTHSIGKVGLERSYESILLGEVGDEHIEANAHGRVLRVLEQSPPTPGEDLHLFIDTELQRVAFEALAGRRGSVVAIDVATGGVLAMASAPSYDPNLFVTGISFADYKYLRESHNLPLFNRSIQGQYPPGSTVKPLMGLAGLQTNTVTANTTVRDPGFYRLPNDSRKYREWKKWGHGNAVDLREAIAESCDIYFYDLGHRMGIDLMHEYGVQFGLGSRTGIDMPGERPGIWPSRQWKRQDRRLPWFPGDNLNTSIGQGYVLATPLQLAVMTATIATRGEQLKPRLVAQVGDTPTQREVVHQVNIAPQHWDYVFNAMRDVVHGPHGTARVIAKDLAYDIAGKTGTAQVVGIAQGEEYNAEELEERHRDHALFVAFAPVKNPKIAVAVMVENGEHGSSTAGPVAHAVLDAYMAGVDDAP
jgi:penicillin-binding protein 2